MNRPEKSGSASSFSADRVAALFRLFRLDAALEYDEIWTLENYASASLKVIFTELALPNNHPLNSLAVKLTAFSGGAPQWIRLVPFLAGVLAVPLAAPRRSALEAPERRALEHVLRRRPAAGRVLLAAGARLFAAALLSAGGSPPDCSRRGDAPSRDAPESCSARAGAMLTLPTSAFYLAAIGSAGLYRCRKDYRNPPPGGVFSGGRRRPGP